MDKFIHNPRPAHFDSILIECGLCGEQMILSDYCYVHISTNKHECSKGDKMGPCMCGDICCASCGPAQGNYKCSVCGVWESDGGCADPEKCIKIAAEWAELEAKQYEEWDRLQEEAENYFKEGN